MIDDSIKRIKGRNGSFDSVRGENCRTAKLTDFTVKKIRENRLGLSQRKLAEMYGVGQATINDIIKGKTWKHLL